MTQTSPQPHDFDGAPRHDESRTHRRRISDIGTTGSSVGAALAGCALAIAGAFLHRHVVQLLGVLLPWGALLAIAAIGMRCRFLRVADGRGSRAFAMALGWILTTAMFAVVTRGDLVIASDVLGIGYLLTGALAVAVTSGWPSPAERQRWTALRR